MHFTEVHGTEMKQIKTSETIFKYVQSILQTHFKGIYVL